MRRAALFMAIAASLFCAALQAKDRQAALADKGVRYETPLFWSRESLRSAEGLNPDHKELLEFLFRKFPDGKLGQNPFAGAKTCAVVGNSGNLRGAGYGPAIDGHDAVLRMNDAVTKGHEADVGRKTTIVMTNANKMPGVVSAEAHWVTYADAIPETLHTIHKWLQGPTLATFKSVNVLSQRFFDSLRPITKSKPSTGLAAVVMALHHCDEVDLYGFGKDATGQWDHYYTGETWNPGGTFHDVSREEAFLNELERKRLVRIHRGKR